MTYRHLLLLGTTTLAVGIAAPAAAQPQAGAPAAAGQSGKEAQPQDRTADDGTADVMVTAQRQQYLGDIPVKDIPQSIQTISAETLTEAGITRLDNALDFAAGFSRQQNFGGLWDAFAVRGFAGDENTASNYLVNGFNAARGYGGPRDTVDVERIEILKGPTSALLGRGEPGGTVNLITKKPQFDPAGAVTASGGSFDTYRGEADLTGPITGGIAARVTGAYQQGDSFRDFISTKKWTVTPSVLVNLAPDTSFSYELNYIHQELPFDRGVVAVNGVLGRIPRSRFLGEPGNGQNKINALGHQAQLQHDFSKDWSMILGVGYRDTTLKGFSSEAELTAARQKFFVDGRTLSRQRRYRDYHTTDLTIRGELSGRFATGSFEHHLLVGADWDNYDIRTVQRRFRPPVVAAQTTLAAGNAIDIFNPVYGTLPAVSPFIDNLETQTSYGFYLQDQVDLTERLKLRFGGRYDSFEQRIQNYLTATKTFQGPTAFSPQVGLAYDAGRLVTFYASYGKGFRPNVGVDARSQPFTPEKTKSWEAGAKVSLLGGRLTGTATYFDTSKTNVLTADPINAGFSLAIGEARSRGAEANLTGSLPGGFRVNLNYAHTRAEVAKDVLDPNFAVPLRKGDPLLNIPRNTASGLVFKDFAVAGSKLTLGGGVQYVGRRVGETATQFFLPAYTLTQVMASFEPTDHIRLAGEVTNLFDVTYYPSSYARVWVAPGNPRQFMLHATYRF